MKFLVLTSAAFTAGRLWIGAQNWLRKRAGSPPLRRIYVNVPIAATGGILGLFRKCSSRWRRW
jgi:hypothetical protein